MCVYKCMHILTETEKERGRERKNNAQTRTFFTKICLLVIRLNNLLELLP